MKKELKLWLHGLSILLIFILFLIPFSILSTDINKYKNNINNEINILNLKIDSLENELENKNDTIIIKPIKLEIYECKRS